MQKKPLIFLNTGLFVLPSSYCYGGNSNDKRIDRLDKDRFFFRKYKYEGALVVVASQTDK